MRKFYYTTLLVVSLIIAGSLKGITYIIPEKQDRTPSATVENTAAASLEKNTSMQTEEATTEELTDATTEQSTTETLTAAATEQSTTEAVTDEPKDTGIEYFDNTLFIGDSRTVGLSEYGDLGNAEVFADNGMSVYKIWNTTVTLKSGEKSKLENLLTDNKYDKIYIMLGINELGYDFDQTVKEFTQLIKDIRKLQPSALLIVEGNLHVTKQKGADSKYFNNERINKFNYAISQLADNSKIYYLDVNEYFDDSEGNLSEDYTGDGAHIYGKYYAEWIEWILSKAIY